MGWASWSQENSPGSCTRSLRNGKWHCTCSSYLPKPRSVCGSEQAAGSPTRGQQQVVPRCTSALTKAQADRLPGSAACSSRAFWGLKNPSLQMAVQEGTYCLWNRASPHPSLGLPCCPPQAKSAEGSPPRPCLAQGTRTAHVTGAPSPCSAQPRPEGFREERRLYGYRVTQLVKRAARLLNLENHKTTTQMSRAAVPAEQPQARSGRLAAGGEQPRWQQSVPRAVLGSPRPAYPARPAPSTAQTASAAWPEQPSGPLRGHLLLGRVSGMLLSQHTLKQPHLRRPTAPQEPSRSGSSRQAR